MRSSARVKRRHLIEVSTGSEAGVKFAKLRVSGSSQPRPVVKRPVDKKDIRKDLESQVDAFLREGGKIEPIERGETGLDRNKPWSNPFQSGQSHEPPKERTPVPEVLAAIDSRKQKESRKVKNRGPKKVWIYDDFGEPVRWVWKES